MVFPFVTSQGVLDLCVYFSSMCILSVVLLVKMICLGCYYVTSHKVVYFLPFVCVDCLMMALMISTELLNGRWFETRSILIRHCVLWQNTEPEIASIVVPS